jgi:prophage regulatory protein
MTKKQHQAEPSTLDRLLPMPTVMDITSLSKATIYRKVDKGTFPAPLKIAKSRVAWRQSDIAAWIAAQGYSA